MNILQKILFGTAVLLLASCVKEQDNTQEGQDVVITLDAGTRSSEPGATADRYINSLRVLGYNSVSGQLSFNEKVDFTGSNATNFQDIINVKTGTFTVVFIANEHADPATSALLNAIGSTSATSNLAHIKGISFSYGAFSATKDIPMVKIKNSVHIKGDNLLSDPEINSGADISTSWNVELERIGIRVDLTLKLTDAQKTAWQSGTHNGRVYLNNVPVKAYIFPGMDNSDVLLTGNEIFVSPTAASPAVVGGLNIFEYTRVILPESIIKESNPATAKTKALTLSLYEGATKRTGIINSGIAGYNSSLPRNLWVGVTATVKDDEVDFEIEVSSWTDKNMSQILQ